MDESYYRAVDEMERLKVRRDYLLGWIGGYLGNPKLEEQRVTEAYEAGYEHGADRDRSHFSEWIEDAAESPP